LTGLENTTYSGMRGNMILFLADRQDRVAKRLNTKIERLDQRLTILEEREQAK
jgi:chaperonin cofactor prefoldin